MTKLNLKFGPPPATKFEVTPSAKEVQFFNDNGFLVVERLTTDEEIAVDPADLRVHLFERARERSARTGRPFRHAATRRREQARAGVSPRNRISGTADDQPLAQREAVCGGTARRRCIRAVELGPHDQETARRSAALWHQDHAYWQPELDYYALGVWLPMHDVTTEMGAMQFIPGSHKRGLLRHHHGDEPQHNVLEVDEPFDVSKAVACPLKMGGATFHHSETLHYTAPNTTDTPRLAFPMEFQITPVRRSKPVSMPWMEEFRKATGGRDKI